MRSVVFHVYPEQGQDRIFQASQKVLSNVSIEGGESEVGWIWRNYQVSQQLLLCTSFFVLSGDSFAPFSAALYTHMHMNKIK